MSSRSTRPSYASLRFVTLQFTSSSFASKAVLGAAIAASVTFAMAQASKPEAVHQHAHVHGVAKLGVALQGKTATLVLESPLDSLIGFEHRANTPTEKAAVAVLQAKMQSPQDLFRFNAEADCSLTKSQAESAIFSPPPSGGGAEEHADLDANFEFTCANPDKLTMLDVGLFKIYPKLHKLDVDVATDKGQFKRNLISPAHAVVLTR